MVTPIETLWEIDPHTKAKHDILQRYLEAWFPILSSHHHRIVYIDGFAGPGRYKGGELGSPIIALNVAMHHRKTLNGELVFWFIDERLDRIEHLKQELCGMAIPDHFKVLAEVGKFHDKVGPVLESIEADGAHIAPTFAFIDPFGFSGVPFSLIKRLLKHPRCETFITFMIDAIKRFLEHPNELVVRHIVEVFGTDEVIKIAQMGGDRIKRLRIFYQELLLQVANYVRYFEMRDRCNRTQYYLFFASNHELGHLKMKEAMWRVNPEGEFRFSDATNPNQFVLFEADTTSFLIQQLRKEFVGKGIVTGGQIRKFVENKTAYLKKHMTAALRQEECAGRINCEATKLGGQPRKKNTYPEDARVSFL